MNPESGGGAPAPDAPATLAIDGAIATITLNRPLAFNAIDPSISLCLEGIARHVEAAEQVTVVTVKGRAARSAPVVIFRPSPAMPVPW